MAFGLERLDQVRQRLGGPAHQAHRVALGLQELLQIGQQGWVGAHQLFSAGSWPTDAGAWFVGLAGFPFS